MADMNPMDNRDIVAEKMNWKSVIRIVFFALVIAWCVYTAVAYAMEVCSVTSHFGGFVNTKEIDNINIDGSDFTPIFLLLGHGANLLTAASMVILAILYIALMVVFTIIPIVVLRLIAIKKDSVVSSMEYKITKWIYIVSMLASVVIGLIATEFGGLLWIALYNGIWALLALIYVLGLKSKVRPSERPLPDTASCN